MGLDTDHPRYSPYRMDYVGNLMAKRPQQRQA